MNKPLFFIRQATLADAPAIARVNVQSWQESYQGIIDQDVLDNLLVEERLSWRVKVYTVSTEGHYVACMNETIVGFCDTGISRSSYAKGEIYSMYVLDSHKRMGVGNALFAAATSYFLTKDLYPFLAWALKANNEACAFYEHHGGQVCATRKHMISGKGYPEVCYRFY